MSVEKEWYNQVLFYHRDLVFNSSNKSILELVLSTSTSDLKSFSNPSLMLNILNDSSRWNQILNIQNCMELINTIKEEKGNIESAYNSGDNVEILKKYSSDRTLRIVFKNTNNSNEKAVAIAIIHSDTNYGLVIVPYDIFLSLLTIVNNFINNYIMITLQLTTRSIMSEVFFKNLDIRNTLVSNSRSQILQENEVDSKVSDSFSNTTLEKLKENPKNDSNFGATPEFDDFLKVTEDKVKIEGIEDLDRSVKKEEEKQKVKKSNSFFINEFLQNDFSNLTKMMEFVSSRENPIDHLISLIKNKSKNDIDLLPGISEEDKKSICYISKVTYETILQNNIRNMVPISSSIPILRFDGKDSNLSTFSMNLLYDLLLLTAYVRVLRSKLENRQSNPLLNYSSLYLSIRCFCDVFVYSFIDRLELSILKTQVLNRFEEYKGEGFFNYSENVLSDYNCKPVERKDIEDFLDELDSKVLKKSSFINKNHQFFFEKGSIKLPYDNNFKLEQIIKQIIPIEVYLKVTKDSLSSEEDIYGKTNIAVKIDPEISKMFISKESKKKSKDEELDEVIKEKSKDDSNLLRFVKTYKNEIPEEVRDKVLKGLDKIGNGELDLEELYNSINNFSDFGENVIKAFYLWSTEYPQVTKSYRNFISMIENCVMGKDSILARLSDNDKKESEVTADDWTLDLS